jgi:hypothetical protein
MTAGPSIDPTEFLHEHLAQASPDLLRELMQGFINTLLSADADSVCGAAYGTRDPDRANRRNGYRHRDLDTRIGTLGEAIPKLREGSYFPTGCSSDVIAPKLHSPRWSRPATCSVCLRGGWIGWCSRWASPACRSPESA